MDSRIEVIGGIDGSMAFVKNYILPILLPMLSAFLSYFISIRVFNRQENVKAEKKKIDVVNQSMCKLFSALTTLLQVKSNYYKGVCASTNPIERALMFPVVVIYGAPISIDVSELTCLISEGEGKVGESGSNEAEKLDIIVIEDVLRRYNSLLEAIKLRNEFDKECRGKIISAAGSPVPSSRMKNDDIVNIIGANDAAFYIDISERLMLMIDGLIMDIYSLLKNFPEYSESLINKKKVKGYVKILKFEDLEVRYPLIDSPITRPSIGLMSHYLGYQEDEILNRYPYC
ncbi:TPA: hypothetical protein RY372_004539 [Escherichia albertii]|nr:hypothetical protein [Escherichia albertii]HEB1503784.1 hypothetical protein [Escherichia albertii]